MVSKVSKFLGNDILYHAIIHSNIKDVVGLLDGQEANVNVQNVNGNTPLHVAVDQQNSIITEILLKYGANPNIQEYNFIGGKTPLHIAVQKNNYEICQLLLEFGSDPSKQSYNGFTCLHEACRNGNKDIAKLLISNGVDINLRDKNGFNASYWAKTMKHPELLELLPPPKNITPHDYYEFKQQLREIHEFTVKIKLKGSKKKKKKKKKK